jgi:hypothetical protein
VVVVRLLRVVVGAAVVVDVAVVDAAALREVGLEAEIGTVLGGEPSDPSRCRVLYLSPTGEVPRGETVSVTCQEF